MPDNLTISISADTTKLRADLALAQAELKKFTTEMRQAAQASLRTGDASAVQQISRNVEQATSRVAALRSELNATHRTVAETSHFQAMRGALGEINKATREFGQSLTEMADRVIPHFREVLALASVAGVVEFVRGVKEAATAIDEMDESAKDLGVTVQEFQAIQLAGARAGIDDFTTGLGRLRREIGQARIDAARTGGADLGGIILRGGRGVQLGDAPGVGVLRGGQQDPLVQQGTALQRLRINVANYRDTFEDSAKLYRDIATALNNIATQSVRAEIAGELFGRNWRTYTHLLEDFAKNADEAAKALREANVEIGENTIAAAEKFQSHWATMATVVRQAWQIISQILGQAMLPLMDAIVAAVGRNMGAWQRWATTVTQSVMPVVQDLANYISSLGTQRPQTAWGQEIIRTFEGISAAARLTFSIISTGFNGMVAIANVAATAINSVFGTHLDGLQIVVTALALRFVGFFRVVTAGFNVLRAIITPVLPLLARLGPLIRALFAVSAGVAGGISWPALLVAGLVALGAALVTANVHWSELLQTIQNFATEAAAAINGLVQTITGAWDGFFSWIGEKLAWLGQKIADAASSLASLFSSSTGGGDTSGATAGGFARGGSVPGTGSGDTVPAWLTPGEFVARKSSVGYYGANVFRAMNAQMIPRDMFRGWGYALGGLVDSIHRPVQHFADGGMVAASAGATTPVHLHLGSREFVTHAAPHIAEALVREARGQSMRSAGIKPSWVS